MAVRQHEGSTAAPWQYGSTRAVPQQAAPWQYGSTRAVRQHNGSTAARGQYGTHLQRRQHVGGVQHALQNLRTV